MKHHPNLGRRAILLAAAATPLVRAQAVARVVCGFPAGSSVDLMTRIIAEELARETGRPFVVENRSGAGGAIAARATASAPADGSMFLVAPSTNLVVYPHTVSNPGYDALKDLVPVSYIGSYTLGLGVKNDPALPDLKSFVEAAKKDPKFATYGSPGAGSVPHFYGLKLGQALGLKPVHVPYRGTGPALLDVIGGVLGAVVSPVGTMLEQKKSGNLRLLATSGAQRNLRAPDVPTFAELGYKDLVATGWFGVFAPKGTPAADAERINQLLGRAFMRPDIHARLAAVDLDPQPKTNEVFAAEIASEYRSWEAIVRSSGFRGEG
jgi:tripartite-type tricarboxylate transporter receptor subunit TctC